MQRVLISLTAVTAVFLQACSPSGSGTWFKGDFAQAQAEARQRDTIIMIDFYTDWCGWCRRYDAETFSDADVREELGNLVALRVNAEKEGLELASQYGVQSFPMVVFVDPDGNEVDRILGFLPPGPFIDQVQRVRAGDSLSACLQRLKKDPGDREALERAVPLLLERSDAESALDRLEAFHAAMGGGEPDDACAILAFTARAELLDATYQRVARRFRRGWESGAELGSLRVTPRLAAIQGGDLTGLSERELAAQLRSALHDDGGTILDGVPVAALSRDELFAVADFSFRTGHCEAAGDLYRRWYERAGTIATSSVLNTTAWRLYLCRTQLELGV
ncbi:MAG: thioredoxin fold domain-containing protein, partial [bacterium]|nr:thioredoxin fold domain-containing protein [bacterium]